MRSFAPLATPIATPIATLMTTLFATLAAGVVAAPSAHAQANDVPSCMRPPDYCMGAGFSSRPATVDCDLHPDSCRPPTVPPKSRRAQDPAGGDREADAAASGVGSGSGAAR